MMKTAHPALLPAGLADVLPPNAMQEAKVTEDLIHSFSACGYERVKPPLIEFEDTLTSGSGAATADQSFRLMDPVSQRMLAVRADMTIQIARIATTRFPDAPRPLRLSYAGQVLRVKGSTLRPERQFGQVGAELIGSVLPTADAEVILMAHQAITNLGIEDISIDLGLPTLVPAICQYLGITKSNDVQTLRTALNQKDANAVNKLPEPAAQIFGQLLSAVGPAADALRVIKDISLPAPALRQCEHLEAVISILRKKAADMTLTLDPVEIRGYEYHSGVTFTLFSPKVRGELGRGGRYQLSGHAEAGEQEEATGVTLFVDTIMRSIPAPVPTRRLFALLGTPLKEIADHRADGWVVIEALADHSDPAAEARRLGCSHVIQNSVIKNV